MKDIRCGKCNKLLFKFDEPIVGHHVRSGNDILRIKEKIGTCTVEIKCGRCGKLNQEYLPSFSVECVNN